MTECIAYAGQSIIYLNRSWQSRKIYREKDKVLKTNRASLLNKILDDYKCAQIYVSGCFCWEISFYWKGSVNNNASFCFKLWMWTVLKIPPAIRTDIYIPCHSWLLITAGVANLWPWGQILHTEPLDPACGAMAFTGRELSLHHTPDKQHRLLWKAALLVPHCSWAAGNSRSWVPSNLSWIVPAPLTRKCCWPLN